MPELPEVETVRRGLEPVMAGARILHVDVRRPDLRFPLPSDFAQRLGGRRSRGWAGAPNTCSPISRPAPCWSCISACRARSACSIAAGQRAGPLPSRPLGRPRPRPRRLPPLGRRDGHLQRSAPLRLHEAGAPRRPRRRAPFRGMGLEPLGNALDAAALARACARQEDAPEGRADRPAPRRGARQHLRVRGAASRPAVADARRRHPGVAQRRAERARRAGWPRRSATC